MPDAVFHMESLEQKLIILEAKLDEAKDDRKRMQIAMALITALITAAVGFGGWLAQSRVQQHIDQKTAELETRLALIQQFYARKLATYEGVHQQMASFIDALSGIQLNPGEKKPAVDAIHNLYMAYTTSTLYLSNEAVAELAKLVDLGNRIPPLDPAGTATMEQVDQEVAAIEDQMKTDLQIHELGRIPGVKGKPKP